MPKNQLNPVALETKTQLCRLLDLYFDSLTS